MIDFYPGGKYSDPFICRIHEQHGIGLVELQILDFLVF